MGETVGKRTGSRFVFDVGVKYTGQALLTSGS